MRTLRSRWSPALTWALGGWLVLRVLSELVALVTLYGVQFPNVLRRSPSVLVTAWNHWDANWFVAIADRGYVGSSTGQYKTAAFGPVLPYAMRAVSRVLHVSAPTAGILVTNAALIVALVLLYRLVDSAHGPRVAAATVVALLLWPASFFLVAPYTEAVVLLFGVLAFTLARQGRWLLAGVAVAAAVMTKSLMVAALAGLLWECVVERRRSPKRTLARDAAMLLLPTAIALGAWMFYMHHLFGDALAFVHAQTTFGRSIGAPWTLLHRVAGDFLNLRFLDTPQASAMEPFDALTVLLVVAAAVYWWRARQRGYAVWLGVAALVFVCSGVLLSETREVVALFPVAVAGAVALSRRPWIERVYAPAGVVAAVFLVTRFVSDRFAG